MNQKMEVLIPDIGDFEEVDVIEILVSKGDVVYLETPLLTLESDKATMDIPSPTAGKVNQICVSVGDKVGKGDKAFEIEELNTNEARSPDTRNNEFPQASKGEPSASTPPQKTIEIRVPDIGDFDEVDIVEILIAEGDIVEKEQPIVVLESDKATMDLPCPKKGLIQKVCVQLGDKVGEGDLLSVIAPLDEPIFTSEKNIVTTPSAQGPIPTATKQSIPKETNKNKNQVSHASPSVRKFARELGVDVMRVQGSGRKSRVLHSDVQAYVKKQIAIQDNKNHNLPNSNVIAEIDYSQFGGTEKIELTKIQKLTGENLHRSWITAPHVFQMDEADITDLERFRRSKLEEIMEKKIKLTLLAFIIKACANTLVKFPRFNSALNNDLASITHKKYVNIGFAVNTEKGLIVPVIKGADKKGVIEIAGEIQELAKKARENKITPPDLKGGNFTISNLGSISGTYFTPVINTPEVAILGVSPSKMTPVWKNGSFIPRLILPITLSYDHRVIDGVAGAEFTAYFTKILGDIRQALL